MAKSSYPGTLSHFCGDNSVPLKSILSSKFFKPSFAKEGVSSTKIKTPEFFVPMVSFCDFKIHELNLHFTKYGKFGIGISKKWGIDKGLNPVFYVSDKCGLFNDMWDTTNNCLENSLSIIRNRSTDIFNAFEQLDVVKLNNSELIKSSEIQKALADYCKSNKFLCYVKNYQGELKRGKKEIKDFRYADDREWRYVPDTEFKIVPKELPKEITGGIDYDKERLNKELIHSIHYLKFEYDDIKFIFVPNEKARLNLIKFIKKLKNETEETINLLISKILVIGDLDL